jgi:hypothetical protein
MKKNREKREENISKIGKSSKETPSLTQIVGCERIGQSQEE